GEAPPAWVENHPAGEGGKGVGCRGQPAEQNAMLVGWLPAAGSGRRRAVRDGDEAELVGDAINFEVGLGVSGHFCPPSLIRGMQPPVDEVVEHIRSGRNYGPSRILKLLSSISLRSQIMLWV